MYSFGFDPGINYCAWALVDDKFNVVLCGMIKNPAKTKVKGWDKLTEMIPEVERVLGDILERRYAKDIHYWICEGQYPGPGNPDHQTRNGWLSAIAYSFGKMSRERHIAIPSNWTKNQPKEMRHDVLLNQVVKNAPEDWEWYGKPCSASLMHNIYDAVGLAAWGIQNLKGV